VELIFREASEDRRFSNCAVANEDDAWVLRLAHPDMAEKLNRGEKVPRFENGQF
jgi:hypothetical protein